MWGRELAAEHAAWMLLPVFGGSITPAVLLGRELPVVKIDPANFASREDFLAAVEAARKR